MKVDWPPARSSLAPIRVKMRSTTPMRATFRGYEQADLRHERDERDLTHVGRLTGHVGAGDDGGAVLALAHIGVVRDEERVLEHALDDGVAAVVNFDDAAVVHARTAIVVVHRDGRERAERVELGDEPRRALDAHALGGDGLAQGGENFKFERLVAISRGQNLLLKVFKFLGDVALAVHERLLADVSVGDEVLERIRDLDIVEVLKKVVGVFVLTLAIRFFACTSFSYVLLRLTQRHRQLSSAPLLYRGLEFVQGPRPRHLHPQADARERRALHHRGT